MNFNNSLKGFYKAVHSEYYPLDLLILKKGLTNPYAIRKKRIKISVDYIKSNEEIPFDQIRDRECFYSGGVLYMKILQQDLEAYGIDCINAISILNAGLTFFDADEYVYRAEKKLRDISNNFNRRQQYCTSK